MLMAPNPAPPEAARFFGGRTPQVAAFVELLATAGVTRGLLGPREAPRLWSRHILNCAALLELIDDDVQLCDVGSGAGLPGIVLAIARPQLSVTLVEPMQRRVTFLEEAVATLALSNVTVIRARAEELAGRLTTDLVVVRAVAPLSKLLGWTWPLLARGGRLLAMKGASAEAEVLDAGPELARLQARHRIVACGVGALEPPVTVVEVVRS